MLNLKLSEIAHITGGKIVQCDDPNVFIQRVVFDSRQIHFPTAAMFFAIKGPRRDGAQYLQEAYTEGIRDFLLQNDWIQAPKDVRILRVENVMNALHLLAIHHRHLFTYPVIGITGSNGKTIVKEWLASMLQEEKRVIKSPKSFNSQLGVPLSIFEMSADNDIALIEAGISQPGEMAKLAQIIDPDIGIFTNLGKAHQEGFESMRQKLEEKARLFIHAKTIIFEATEELSFYFHSHFKDKTLFTWSTTKPESDVFIHVKGTSANGTDIMLHHGGENMELRVSFRDRVNLHNCFTCIAYLAFQGYSPSHIGRLIATLRPIGMRMELKAGMLNSTLIDDTYNSDLDSIQAAISATLSIEPEKQKIFIISDIYQAGMDSDLLYMRLSYLINESNPRLFIGIGNEIRNISQHLTQGISALFYSDVEDFLRHFEIARIQDSIVLIKGSRRFGLEQISRQLANYRHETRLEINLNALTHNLQEYSRHIRQGTAIMVMVKAGAYGSGAAEVARLLARQRVDFLTVAYPEEGIELRNAGIRTPIMVMNCGNDQFERLRDHSLDIEIFSREQLRSAISFIRHRAGKLRIHLKLDTGMHRLGFISTDLEELTRLLSQEKKLQVISIFSHLAASGEELHDEFTRQQVRIFESMSAQIMATMEEKPMRHVLNSSGILRFPEYQYEMVRLGIGLYGIDPSGEINSLQTVFSLKTAISQIKDLAIGDTVGYSRKWRAEKPSKIATIAVGYADGLRRSAGNGRWQVLIHNKPAPIVGSVCMDMCMIDITAIPEAKTGDEVLIFGPGSSAEQLAAIYDTIPYEVFTGISTRVRRIYVME